MRLSRAGLVAWLLAPFAVVGGLALMMDRSRGRAHLDGAAPRGALLSSSSAQPAQPIQPESLTQGFIIVVEDKSQVASAASPIFLASSHNGWNPGDPDRKLTQRSDGRWQIALPKPKLDSRMAFKFARGDWDHVEVAADLKDIENRLLPLVDPATIKPGEPPVIELIIEKWVDMRGGGGGPPPLPEVYREISVAGGGGAIRRVQVVGGWSDGFVRDVIVWLPPGYDDPAGAERRYPVLYMQDGQNLFQKHDKIPAEWGVDETATRLIAEKKIEPLIIVGIPHADSFRASEYLPVAAIKDVEPRGENYIQFLLGEVMPRIEHVFRVRTGPENTAIGGSSLGGLISLYAGAAHPDVFGKVLAESPSLVLGGREVWREAFGGRPTIARFVFLGMGGKEFGDGADAADGNQRLVASVKEVRQWSLERSGADGQVQLLIEDAANHNEQAWAGRLAQALEFLFPAPKR